MAGSCRPFGPEQKARGTEGAACRRPLGLAEAVTLCLAWDKTAEPVLLTGVELEEQLDGVVIEVTAVQDDLDEWREAALASGGHRHRARHVQGVEHWGGRPQ